MTAEGNEWEYLQALLIFAPLSFALLWLAATRGFFSPIPERAPFKTVLSLKSVLIFFAIYLITTMGIATVLSHLIVAIYSLRGIPIPPLAMSHLQLVILIATLLLLWLYSRTLDRPLIRRIWKDSSLPTTRSISWDIFLGILTWTFSFPLVIVIGQITDLLLVIFFQFQSYEQVAVRYLKSAISSPEMLTVALLTILFFAPVIEEFLFRGILQTFFKRFVSVRKAILLSSLSFALFHYAPSQGIGNLSLFASLFTFALFLGYIYERQGSLFASIALHQTFNAASTFRILFFPE